MITVKTGSIRLGAVAAAMAIAASPPPSTIQPADIISHLEQTIAWYRHVDSVEETASDVLLREDTDQSALKALQLGFTFAQAEAALLETKTPAGAPKPEAGNLQQASARAADRVSSIQSRITELDARIRTASPRERATLEAERGELASELDLARQIQSAVQTLVSFSGNAAVNGAGLTAQIQALERSVPQAQPAAKASAPTTTTAATKAAAPETFSPESRGIIGLIEDLFTISDRRKLFSNAEKETDALLGNIDRLRTPLLNETRTAIEQADAIGNAAAPQSAAAAKAAQDQLTALSARFKQLSAAMLPLSEQGIAASSVRTNLQESVTDLDQTFEQDGRYLLIRGIMLGGAIFIILVISEIWRRATFRYVTDARRRRQFLSVRRIVVSCAVLFAIVAGFLTEFGSLATYAGFVTAGIAVALQSPILSVVAYFFLIGRYGVRVGDRVTISGVTGEVVEIGLVRIYLMELGPDGHSTGRIVVFSNSVIFQPSALYKQMPGIDYAWHTVTLTLSKESDFQLADKKLREAVDSVYQQYRDALDSQYRALQQSTELSMSAPKPDCRLRYTDAGVEFTVRYPVVLRDAAITDERFMKALHEAIEREPKLEFAPSGFPKAA